MLSRFDVAVDVAEEAEKCFALDRFAGCVYHLMRVVEVGVQALGKHLQLSDEILAESWGRIVAAVQKKAEKMAHNTLEKEEAQRSVSEIADALFHVNLAWRIPTDHPRVPNQSYNKVQADEALGRVKALMRHLSETI